MAEILINDLTPLNQYTATAAQTDFDYTWPIFASGDLVAKRTRAGVPTTLVLGAGADYTLSGVGDAGGGTLTLTTGADVNDVYTLYRNAAIARTSDYQPAGDFLTATLNRDLDYIIMMSQQNERDIARTLRLAIEDEGDGADFELPAKDDRASQFLGFDSDGKPIAAAGTSADLGPVSAFVDTLLDDADADTFWATLMASITKATAMSSLGAANLTAVNTFTKTQTWTKGADIASATTLALGTDGNYFDVTGATAITAITAVTGTFFMLHFDAALTLTHHATNLILPSGANITTAAGDEALFFAYASGDVRCVSYTKADGRAIINIILGTAILTTSGSTHSFTGLPANIKRINITLAGVSTDGIAVELIRLSTSSSFVATGYLGTAADFAAAANATVSYTTGFGLAETGAAANAYSGILTLEREDGNTWVISGGNTRDTNKASATRGTITLAGELDGIQIFTTDTFDAGSINISYES